MIVFLGMMMAKDLIQVSARSREVSRQEEVIATPVLPKEGYAGDACDKPGINSEPIAERY
ncbi:MULTISPECIES: hypothetical protein [Bradyrhizobium]|uniref:Uncharacterized protein n=1 Tax=Bradyrhizobium zhanjiangense TaxID=1325107 RepID=A0A4Q0SRT4_9BRAD|nr:MULTISPECIES: hypothetical protein [Bradyrhizobium]RXG83762.1 hypothetical protein EAS61_41065 [Bradyrhizobium zhanjiangense]RXH41660.1 hypothetical protein XH94_06645 [Bradyrhizobium zhanjiangense]UQR60224.1 hypothetical protein LRP30_24700 [Bradyrhizobium sp. C-145]